MIVFVLVLALVVVVVNLFTKQSSFGRVPQGERLERIKLSPHYKGDSFQNIHNTPNLTEGVSYYRMFKEFFFTKHPNRKPPRELPNKKANLHTLSPRENVLVWFGHSSYFIQADEKKILVDPVFSGNASPVTFTTPAFEGADVYTVDELPEIDFLFLSHDHWDHLDYKTVVALKSKTKKIITGLGTAAHLERWGFDMNNVYEKDWNETIDLGDGFVVTTLPARHFSGRAFARNRSLWMSFALTTPTTKLYLGGDSGYDTHFAEIGRDHGPFDLAILECGQYNIKWKYIHMMPEEVVQAAIDLRSKKLLPVHWGKFTLSEHEWTDPIIRVTNESEKRNLPIIYPMIGEKVDLRSDTQHFTKWWETV